MIRFICWWRVSKPRWEGPPRIKDRKKVTVNKRMMMVNRNGAGLSQV